MDEVVLSSCFLLFKNSIPTSTHIKPHISTAVEMCGNLWVAFSQDYSHPQISTTVEICGNLWVAFHPQPRLQPRLHPQPPTDFHNGGNVWKSVGGL